MNDILENITMNDTLELLTDEIILKSTQQITTQCHMAEIACARFHVPLTVCCRILYTEHPHDTFTGTIMLWRYIRDKCDNWKEFMVSMQEMLTDIHLRSYI
jgi:hypothetical protein